MMTYLNGLDENSSLAGKGRFKKFAKHIGEKAEKLHKKIIAQNKALAKKIGAGVKRFAKIKKNVEFKVFLRSMEHNLGGIAVRLKQMYQEKPAETKQFLSTFGDWDKIKAAINKGDKHHKLQNIAGLGEGEGEEGAGADAASQAGQYAEAGKQSVGIIKKIIAWFKKHKKNKAGDDALTDKMENSVGADSTIPKVDENGKELPSVEDPENAAHEQGKEGGEFAKGSSGGFNFKNPYVIAGAAGVVLLGGYMLMKKK